MAASEVSIVNGAMVRLGVATITTLADDSPQARIANRRFTHIRDKLLRDHPWNWATKRVSISASTVSPTWGFSNAFPLPADYMRMMAVQNDSKLEYRIESTSDGKVIVTDLESPLKIAYVALVSAVDQWDVLFNEALSATCAVEWAEGLTGTTTLAEKLQVEAVVALRAAKAVDGQEDSVRTFEVDAFTSARL